MLKKRKLITLLLIPFLLSGCGLSVDINSLHDEPYIKDDTHNDDGSTDGDGNKDDTTDYSRYQVTDDIWNEQIVNLKVFKQNYNFTIKSYTTEVSEANHVYTAEINDGSIMLHGLQANYDFYLKKNNSESYSCYSSSGDNPWEFTGNVSEYDYKDFVEGLHFLYSMNKSLFTFVKSTKAYEADIVTIINNNATSSELRNVKIEFDYNKIVRFTVEYPNSLGYQKQINEFTNYGTTTIDFDYEDTFIDEMVLDGSQGPVDDGDFITEYGKYRFHFHNFTQSSDGSIFGTLNQGGYITNLDPMPHLKSIKLDSALEPGVSPISFKQYCDLIKNPHQGNYKFYYESTVDRTITINEDYFSLYVPNESADITSITLTFEKDYEHNEYDTDETVEIIYFNDLHGHLTYDSAKQPGLTSMMRLCELFYDIRPEGIVMLSGGDQYQGSAYSNMSGGDCTTYLFNALGVDAQIMGNHEFDWGLSTIEATINKCNFPTLGMNVINTETNERFDFLDDCTMVEKKGHKIGIIGSAGNTKSSVAEYNRNGFDLINGSEHAAMVKACSNALKSAGAEFIILMIHDETYDVVNDNPTYYYDESLTKEGYVDLVFDAHTHQEYIREDEYGVLHVQAGQYSEACARIAIDFNNEQPYVFQREIESLSGKHYNNVAGESIFNHFSQPGVGANEVVCSYTPYVSKENISSNLSRLYYDLFSEPATAILESKGIYDDVLLGFNYPLPRAYFQQGQLLFNDIYTALPFDNPLGVASIQGNYLLSVVYNKENTEHYPDVSTSLIDPNETYYVICDAYNFAYSYNHMTLIGMFDADDLRTNYSSTFSNLVSYDSTGYVYARDVMRLGYINNLIS